MITEEDKISIAMFILQHEYNQDPIANENWIDEDKWLDCNGEIWAKSAECNRYVERLKKLKALL